MQLRTVVVASLLALSLAGPARAGEVTHRLAIQVTENDAEKFNLVLNNAANVSQEYNRRGEEVSIEVVAYGPGLHMLRTDTSPVKERLQSFRDGMPNVVFTACGNTVKAMEKKEGKPVTLVDGVDVVTAGVVRLMELQEQGWSYVRP